MSINEPNILLLFLAYFGVKVFESSFIVNNSGSAFVLFCFAEIRIEAHVVSVKLHGPTSGATLSEKFASTLNNSELISPSMVRLFCIESILKYIASEINEVSLLIEE